MAAVTFKDRMYKLNEGETVLEGLLRQGADLAHSCRSGVCQACLVRAKTGTPPAAAQEGLRPTLAAQGYFLACLCRPSEDLEIGDPGNHVPAEIVSVERLNARVARVRLRTDEPFEYEAGQYIQLINPVGVTRPYSLAGLPSEGGLELHVLRVPGGRMSGWVFEEAAPGARISVRGPAGSCFYTPGEPDAPMLLTGTGTGLAPLLGIARGALAAGHRGPIHLFHGALDPEGLYLVDELRRMDAAHENLHYRPCALNGGGNGIPAGDIQDMALGVAPSLEGWRVYLCGAPDLVNAMRKKAFLRGASMGAIHADAFIMGKG